MAPPRASLSLNSRGLAMLNRHSASSLWAFYSIRTDQSIKLFRGRSRQDDEYQTEKEWHQGNQDPRAQLVAEEGPAEEDTGKRRDEIHGGGINSLADINSLNR